MSRWDKSSAITLFSVSFLGYTQLIVHILQGVKASAKRGLKLLGLEGIILMVCKDYDGLMVT
jgi:hypothetical protein